ncbi:hypothetical protein ACVN9X_03160 [Enterococcus dispar]|uniref:Uncharacterized protein n=1 Tax=Enterococcus dispar ATCC 51266 TaxID=1139219 RepID=S1N7C1_9ENTE|nr:hypothetical protein [Enterococcus dispar]EOT42604.1 hypothetical protein OMK_00965 [Enterococcus dispar ATCC 51266]EOW84945.1 hypothetical protein I569_00234 [Enterococcus dispar ATCC 51266]OJG37661.1 hypothetical protein RV01_GL001219 [Enterococcus dispar]
MKIEDISDNLLEEVKDNLFVTWKDNDDQIKIIILKSMNYLQSKVSQKLTIEVFSGYDIEHTLLIERCRYDWNNALNEFEKNFASEILAYIQKYALMDWEENGDVNV